MKKVMMPIALVIFLLLSACSGSAEVKTNNQNEIIINVKNNTDFEMYALELMGYQGSIRRGETGMYADESKIGKGENFSFSFYEHDFILTDEVSFEVTIIEDEYGMNKMTTHNKVPLQLASNTEYNLVIKGDSKDNFTLHVTE